MILYSAYCFKKLYQLSLKRIIVKTFIFFGIRLVFYILIIILILIGMLTYLYQTGGMQEFLESQKPTAYLISSVINWTS
jgi:ABC-type sulfate transport system permease component